MKFEISELAAQYAPWSVSKADLAETCPRQFELKHILKSPEEVVATANQVGSAAHLILEYRLGGMDAKAAKAAALIKIPMTSTEWENLRVLEDAIETFVVKFAAFCKTYDVVDVMIEKKWAIRADGTATDFFASDVFFRGVVDLCALTRQGDLTVIDHKSGVAKDIYKYTKYQKQINVYAVMALANMPNIAGVRGALHFLQGPQHLRLQWLDFTDAHKIKALYTPWLFEFINKCATSLAPRPFQAKASLRVWPCNFCPYKPSCAAHQELLRESEI